MMRPQCGAPRALAKLILHVLGFVTVASQFQTQIDAAATANEPLPVVWPKPKSFTSGDTGAGAVMVVPGPDFFKLTTTTHHSSTDTPTDANDTSDNTTNNNNESSPHSALSRRLSDHLQQAGLHMHVPTQSGVDHWVKYSAETTTETTEKVEDENESKHSKSSQSGSSSSSSSMSVLDLAFRRYMWITFPRKTAFNAHNNKNNNNKMMRGGNSGKGGSSNSASPTVKVNSLLVFVQDMDETHPTLGHDESYTLHINETGYALLSAKTVWGALHGLQTFSQLVVYDFDSERYELSVGLPAAVDDAPRFPQRGLMIDTARHFEPVVVLLRLIASLPNTKINVLHWHISDKQSFPLQSRTFPKLWQGAFSKQERYTIEDARVIVEFARLLGIRVIPELDMPGHAAAWCAGYPEICPSPTCLQPLNVANNKTFVVIEGLMDEFAIGHYTNAYNEDKAMKESGEKGNEKEGAIFPDEMMHLGGDEVNKHCWDTVPSIVEWRKERSMSSTEAYGYFTERVAAAAIKRERRPIQWVEVFNQFGNKLDKKTIVHVWLKNEYVKPVVQAGYNTLVSTPVYYLDHLQNTWADSYDSDPCEGLTDQECGLVLGGHGEMWGETVDPSDLFNTVWPRLAAIGERLWSHDLGMHTDDTLLRLEKFRCLLLQRGVTAGPVQSTKGRDPPPHAGGCAAQ